jgi:transcriptional regulator with XRE-family HTH domain
LRIFSGEQIKIRRLKLKLTQQGLAVMVGISREGINSIERGKKVPKAQTIAKIANALKVKESYFFIKEVAK